MHGYQVANLSAGGKIVSVLEGGYGSPLAAGGFDRAMLAANVHAHVSALCGSPFDSDGAASGGGSKGSKAK